MVFQFVSRFKFDFTRYPPIQMNSKTNTNINIQLLVIPRESLVRTRKKNKYHYHFDHEKIIKPFWNVAEELREAKKMTGSIGRCSRCRVHEIPTCIRHAQVIANQHCRIKSCKFNLAKSCWTNWLFIFHLIKTVRLGRYYTSTYIAWDRYMIFNTVEIYI